MLATDRTEEIRAVTDLLPPVQYKEDPRPPGGKLAGDPVLRGAVRLMAWTLALGFAGVVGEVLLWLRP